MRRQAQTLAGRLTDMVLIEGGVFSMGSDRFYPEEGPVRRVRVDSFRIDALHPHRAKGAEGRFAPVRRKLLPALSPAARHPQTIDSSTSHIGFRCVVRGARP